MATIEEFSNNSDVLNVWMHVRGYRFYSKCWTNKQYHLNKQFACWNCYHCNCDKIVLLALASKGIILFNVNFSCLLYFFVLVTFVCMCVVVDKCIHKCISFLSFNDGLTTIMLIVFKSRLRNNKIPIATDFLYHWRRCWPKTFTAADILIFIYLSW